MDAAALGRVRREPIPVHDDFAQRRAFGGARGQANVGEAIGERRDGGRDADAHQRQRGDDVRQRVLEIDDGRLPGAQPRRQRPRGERVDRTVEGAVVELHAPRDAGVRGRRRLPPRVFADGFGDVHGVSRRWRRREF